jgi:hypothetical protein
MGDDENASDYCRSQRNYKYPLPQTLFIIGRCSGWWLFIATNAACPPIFLVGDVDE